jgi:hypothetical protein
MAQAAAVNRANISKSPVFFHQGDIHDMVMCMKSFLFPALALACAACTPDPAANTTGDAVGGAAVGCGVGAAVTAPLLGVGCAPGAIIGGASGGVAGAASTPPAGYSYDYPPSYYFTRRRRRIPIRRRLMPIRNRKSAESESPRR